VRLYEVAAALTILLISVTVKASSTFQLWERYQPHQYWADPRARRLFLAGKAAPLTACGAIVALAYSIGLWWLIIPAWLFFAVAAYGVILRISQARRRSSSRKLG
jgi:hypothetical protein